MKKEKKDKKNIRYTIQIIFIIIFTLSILSIAYYFYTTHNEKDEYKELLNNVEIDIQEVTKTKTDRMLKLEQLQKENQDIVAWIEIEGTNISYPILQGEDNDYYLTHNYKKEKAITGSLFLDKDYDFSIPSSNLLIYGHRNKQGLMFEDLIKYSKEDFYKEHSKIRFTTLEEDADYEIISVFYSRVYYKSEKDVFRYYYFVNAENEEQYNEFVNNAKKASIYDTGKTAKYGDQLLTLSTCEYSQKDGRFAIVARKLQ